jgi:hypothetical protein
MGEPNNGQKPVGKWEELYQTGRSLRAIAESDDVGYETVRHELDKANVEMRPRGGPNDGSFHVGDARARGIPLHSMSIDERAASLGMVNAPAREVLFLLLDDRFGPGSGLHIRDITKRLSDVSWHKADQARKALERRLFATSREVETRSGRRRLSRITEDGIQAAKILGLPGTELPLERRKRAHLDVAPRSRVQNRGTFSAGDGRPRKQPLSSMPLNERIHSMSLVSTPVWEVLAVLCQAGDGPGLCTATIQKKVPHASWQCVANACKALTLQGFATSDPIDIPTGWKKKVTKVTQDGIRAAKIHGVYD